MGHAPQTALRTLEDKVSLARTARNRGRSRPAVGTECFEGVSGHVTGVSRAMTSS